MKLIAGALALFVGAWEVAAAPTAEQIEFFEKHVRPVLADKCYSCHSAKAEKIKGGLLLDTREAALKGGETGPAVVPGNLEKSLLIKAVRGTDDDLAMPPKKADRLTPAQVTDLEAWVKMGAPDPRTGTAVSAKAVEMDKARQHWAFKPVAKPTAPAVKNKSWVQSPVDAFVLAKLEEKNLKPAPAADKRTLIRRATFDLTGLPPTQKDVDDFLADKSKDAFAKVVERLLASEHYGERWGRYWLDVARYADTKGYLAGGEERKFPFSYTYRDYVIRAFNEDKPFDQFLREQIAADQLPLGEDKTPLAGLGFLTLGRRFLNNQNDIIDDRIDVVMRGTMGLTVVCARCHDHKFDPIPTKDYYSLHGVFASSEEPADRPLLGRLDPSPAYDEFLKEKAKIESDVEKFTTGEVDKYVKKLRGQVGDYLLAARDAARLKTKADVDRLAGERKLTPSTVRDWISELERRGKQHDPIFTPWFAFSAQPEKEFAAKTKELSAKFAANNDPAKPVNSMIAKAFATAPASLKQVAEIYSKAFADTDEAWRKLAEKTPTAKQLPETEREQLRQVLHAANAPANPSADEVKRIIGRRLREGGAKLRNKIEELNRTHPGAPARAMALVDKPRPFNSPVLIRGNQGNPGPEVPRQFLEVLSPATRQPFKQGSGRLELAQAIASKDNPLTARVFVNRVWGWHFGQALVRTPSDFGIRTEAPAHLALLDFLAASFMEQSWSVKQLHRLILLSSAYQQSSEENPRYASADPGNNLLYRQNRRRLDFEAMRDTLLAAAGTLDLTMGGLAVDIAKEPSPTRRTVYGYIDRQNLPAMFRTFDFANPDTSSPQRFATTVPQQALFMMNSPFVVEQARKLVGRREFTEAKTDEQRVQAIHRLLLQRPADKDEAQLAQQFMQAQAARAHAEQPVWQFGSGEFNEAAGHVIYFQRFTNFSKGGTWHPDAKYPSATSGHVSITATGGHPGNGPKLASVRRWTAPADGAVSVEGTLTHDNKPGDGVRGRIISGRSGTLGAWTVRNSRATTKLDRVEVAAGQTLDFIVDCLGDSNSDSYKWAPVIRYVAGDLAGMTRTEFNAEKDFITPGKSTAPLPLSAWEKYAQVLLLSNEMVFVD